MSYLAITIIGVLACASLDLWQRILLIFFKIPTSNWKLVGRWLLRFLKTRSWVQNDLLKNKEMKNELLIGWLFHYFVAIVYALFYYFLVKLELLNYGWADGLLFGIVSVLVPWFVFMPAMGAGILANRTENPKLACSLAVFSHSIFGVVIGILFNFLIKT
jgi:hypothetical protein